MIQWNTQTAIDYNLHNATTLLIRETVTVE